MKIVGVDLKKEELESRFDMLDSCEYFQKCPFSHRQENNYRCGKEESKECLRYRVFKKGDGKK